MVLELWYHHQANWTSPSTAADQSLSAPHARRSSKESRIVRVWGGKYNCLLVVGLVPWSLTALKTPRHLLGSWTIYSWVELVPSTSDHSEGKWISHRFVFAVCVDSQAPKTYKYFWSAVGLGESWLNYATQRLSSYRDEILWRSRSYMVDTLLISLVGYTLPSLS